MWKTYIQPTTLDEALAALAEEARRSTAMLFDHGDVPFDLIVDHVAEQEQMQATEEELDQRIEEIARRRSTEPAKVYASCCATTASPRKCCATEGRSRR